MFARLLPLLLALGAGFGLPTQAGINGQLAAVVRSPVTAALISFAVGTASLLVFFVLLRLPLPAGAALSAQPWWIYSGGLIGAFFVAVIAWIAPQLGATTMLALILAGQLIASVLYDHFGLLGFSVHPLSFGRLAGIGLLVAGVLLIRNS